VREGGPWRINVLTLAPGAQMLAVPGGDAVGARARPSALAGLLRAPAAVNGGYFGEQQVRRGASA
jgi:phage tail sheath protein FI